MDTSPPWHFWAGVPQSILYDNTTLAVARILGDGRRQRTRVFSELQSHYLFDDRFGRPGKDNDKEFWINAKKPASISRVIFQRDAGQFSTATASLEWWFYC
jgi:hypothetical protein